MKDTNATSVITLEVSSKDEPETCAKEDTEAPPPPPPPPPEVVIKFTEEDSFHVTDTCPDSECNNGGQPYKLEFAWYNICGLLFLHGALGYGMLILPTMHNATIGFTWFLAFLTMIGVQAGSHRLWCHRAYKAKFGLRVFLMLCHTMALQNHIYEWSRDHRTHHRFSDTDADPHNRNRGFFFSHIGWTMVKKHPDIKRKGAVIRLDDLEADPVIRFQRKYYEPLAAVLWGILPTFIPVFVWHEKVVASFVACVAARYILTLHVTWLVNSVAHGSFGKKPYNSRIVPVETNIRHVLAGEGFHNYHHQFPWDYSASELGPKDVFNPATLMIDCFAAMGWAYDLKKAKPEMIANTKKGFGDQSEYKKGVCRTVWEWTTGLIVMTVPFWFFVLLKYTYNYLIAQYIPFDLNKLVPF